MGIRTLASRPARLLRTGHPCVRTALWILWGIALIGCRLAAYAYLLRQTTYWPIWAFDQLTGAGALFWRLPFVLLAGSVAFAMRDRIAHARRAWPAVAAVISLCSIGVLAAHAASGLAFESGPYSGTLRALETALRYASLISWAALGGALIPAPNPPRTERPSPLDGLPGADDLTVRERTVLACLVSGATLARVARELSLSPSTVATYRTRACEKLGITSVRDLAASKEQRPADRLDLGMPVAAPLIAAGLSGMFIIRACLTSGSIAAIVIGTLYLAAAPLACMLLARHRGLRLWMPRGLTRSMALVSAGILLQGFLLGGPGFPREPLVTPFAPLAFDISLVLLTGVLGWPIAVAWAAMRSLAPTDALAAPTPDDRERCLMYLRGRGLGELEAQALLLIAEGKGSRAVCDALNIAPGTVNAYRAHGYALLRVHSAEELARLIERDVHPEPAA